MAAKAVSLEERLENVFDTVVYVSRYSKGGMSLTEAMNTPRTRLRDYANALERLVGRENGDKDKPSSEEYDDE